MKLTQKPLINVFLIFFITTAFLERVDARFSSIGHAPIGVMGDHSHGKGKWMISYHYTHMRMKGNRDGAKNVSASKVLDDFMVAPLSMNMDMHRVGFMYGITDKFTVMHMFPYVYKSMNHLHRDKRKFRTQSNGLGDIKLSGIYSLYRFGAGENKKHHEHHESHQMIDENPKHHHSQRQLLLNFGVRLPSGKITKKDDTPKGPHQKLPYPMQLGSGTVDPTIGVVYLDRFMNWSWGTKANVIARFIGKNSEGYRLGSEYSLTAWLSRNVSQYMNLSFRLNGKWWEDIHGKDNDLNPMMVPTADARLRNGHRVDALLGLSLYQVKGKLSGHRLAAEFGLPVHQYLDGPQLETDYHFTFGWQWVF